MSEDILDPAVETPFEEYSVEGIGTVIAPEGEPGYRVRLPDGRVTAFPAKSGNPSAANAADDIAYAITNPTVSVPDFIKRIEVLVQSMLDGKAQENGYDGILSACSYDGDPDARLAAEGAAYKNWRSRVWTACYDALNAYNAENPLPTAEDFIESLPKYIGP